MPEDSATAVAGRLLAVEKQLPELPVPVLIDLADRLEALLASEQVDTAAVARALEGVATLDEREA